MQSQSAAASAPSDLPRSEGNADRADGDLHNLDALIEKGSLLHRLGKTEEAIARFDAARRIAPDHELVLTNLAVALADSGQRHDAVVAFKDLKAQSGKRVRSASVAASGLDHCSLLARQNVERHCEERCL